MTSRCFHPRREEPSFEDLRHARLADTETSLHEIQAAIAHLEERVATWTPGDLVPPPARHQGD